MKVLVLAPPMKSVGGIQRYIDILHRALQDLLNAEKTEKTENAENVRLLALQRSAIKKINKTRRVREVEKVEKVEKLKPRDKLGVVEKERFVWQALREAIYWRPDLVICAHVGLAPIGWLLQNLCQCHYWVIGYGIEVWGRMPFWKQKALRQADKMLAISDFTKAQLIECHQIASERISILPCVLDECLLTASTASPDGDGDRLARVIRIALNGRRKLLTVGRLAASERYKGHEVVLKALPMLQKKVPNIIYLVVGDGDDRSRLEILAKQLGVQDYVMFMGLVTDSELKACYQACDVFVLPSQVILDDRAPKGEGFGIVFLEAMAFGKPVIGPNQGAPAEFIHHGEHGLLVDPQDPKALAQAMTELLGSPARARQMGEAARQWVMSEFSYERFRQRLGQLLNEKM